MWIWRLVGESVQLPYSLGVKNYVLIREPVSQVGFGIQLVWMWNWRLVGETSELSYCFGVKNVMLVRESVSQVRIQLVWRWNWRLVWESSQWPYSYGAYGKKTDVLVPGKYDISCYDYECEMDC